MHGMTMLRRSIVLGLALVTLPSMIWAAEKLSLGAISNYLNGLKTVEGAFTQINADGTVGTGKIYIHRPGRARFEYEQDGALVMVGGSQVAIFDPKSNQPPEQYPLKRTPLNLILKRNVNLGQENMVIAHEFDGTGTSVLAQDPQNPELGNIRLVFTGPVVQLRQWIITGQDGSQTTVILGDVSFDQSIPSVLFSIPAEMTKRGL